MEKPVAAIVAGSDSDWPLLRGATAVPDEFGVSREARVLSAHRSPDRAARYAREASGRGTRVLMAAGGSVAPLAGVIASHTTLPVIGIPFEADAVHGLDALPAMVQMPAGVPVATATLGKAGPTHAALFAVQILALQDRDLDKRLAAYRQALDSRVQEGDRKVRADKVKAKS